jgi:hypothetical protein
VRRLAAERAALARDVPAGARAPRLVFSDTPDFVAWETGRPTLWVDRAAFDRLYPPGGGAGEAARFGLPSRHEIAGWFHDDFRDPTSIGTVVRP